MCVGVSAFRCGIVGLGQVFALLCYIFLYCINPSQQARMTLVIKCLNEGRRRGRKGRREEGGRGREVGRKKERKEGKKVNPCTNSICTEPRRSRTMRSN